MVARRSQCALRSNREAARSIGVARCRPPKGMASPVLSIGRRPIERGLLFLRKNSAIRNFDIGAYNASGGDRCGAKTARAAGRKSSAP